MTKLILPKNISLVEALKMIDAKLKESKPPLVVDMADVSFPLTRDVFLVIKKRFRVDEVSLLLKHTYEIEMARSVGIGASLSGILAEFDREFAKENLIKHNFTAWQYFLYEIKRGFAYIRFLLTRKRVKTPIYKVKKGSPNMFLITAGLIMSFSLLVFIFHFAVSRTYIYITPQISIRPVSSNIIFSKWTGSFLEWKNTVRMKTFSFDVEQTMKFSLDTIDPNSATMSNGKATIYNELPAEQVLKPNTRFVTEDGIVFRSQEWVSVPGSRTINGITEIGMVDISLRADASDEAGKTIGIRWNIQTDTYLSIPWLKFNRDKVYAKAKENFSGGSDPKIHIVTKPEMERFHGIIHEQLQKIARSQIDTKIGENNQSHSENYSLLLADAITMTGETISVVSGQKIGDLANDVELHGKITVNALVFDKTAVIAYLKTIFHDKFLDGREKDLGMHEDTLHLANIISKSDDGSSIKATMEVNSSITYDLENPSNELTRKMKVMISGLSKSEAISRLINTWQVREVNIKFSPFWLTSVSSNLDNIEFVIKN